MSTNHILLVKPQLCIGCRTCEMTCAFAHSVDGRPGTSRIKVYQVGPERYVPMTCLQCVDAACVQVCPTDALVLDPVTGAVVLHQDKCVRCKLCLGACPFGGLQIDPIDGSIVKCDLCGGDPACAKFCPSGALTFVPAHAAGAVESRQLEEAG